MQSIWLKPFLSLLCDRASPAADCGYALAQGFYLRLQWLYKQKCRSSVGLSKRKVFVLMGLLFGPRWVTTNAARPSMLSCCLWGMVRSR